MSVQHQFVIGNVVIWRANVDEGEGVIQATGKRFAVQFPSGKILQFAHLEEFEHRVLPLGARVHSRTRNEDGVILGSLANEGLLYYRVLFPSSEWTAVESDLHEIISSDPLALARGGRFARPVDYWLRTMAARLSFAHQFDEMVSLSNARIVLEPHQIYVAHRVVESYPHRFILADEVGLGKTIEAGLIIRELQARQIVKRVLIVTPAGLTGQWQWEMKTKFNQTFSLYNGDVVRFQKANNPGTNVWELEDCIITSGPFAAYEDDRVREIVEAGWDMVVFDEAHHVRRGERASNKWEANNLYRLAERLKDGPVAMLMLTATPMQLDRSELYSLIEILDPALYADYPGFRHSVDEVPDPNLTAEQAEVFNELPNQERARVVKRVRYYLSGTTHEQRDDDQVSDLLSHETDDKQHALEIMRARHLLSQVMVRNRKTVLGRHNIRTATTIRVELTELERVAYDAVSNYVTTGYQLAQERNNVALGFVMVIFQKMLASSSRAMLGAIGRRIQRLRGGDVIRGLFNLDEIEAIESALDALDPLLAQRAFDAVQTEIDLLMDLGEKIEAIEHDSKAMKLVEAVNAIFHDHPNEKVLIFTQYIETLEYLHDLLCDHGHAAAKFHGKMSLAEKDSAVLHFRQGAAQIMIATEAGGEGRNFQFCHILFNYDLPWNAMKIEQRIGRLDRMGQKYAVFIYNFSVDGTVEARVLDVLQNRIRIFEETVGGLDPILGNVEEDLKRLIMDHGPNFHNEVENLGQNIELNVRKARDAEQRMADFIMDHNSFRRKDAEEIIERAREAPLSYRELQAFIFRFLGSIGCYSEKLEEAVFRLHLHDGFRQLFSDIKPYPRTLTFNPRRALQDEELEFFAFGHEIVDRVVAHCMGAKYNGKVTCLRIRNECDDDDDSRWPEFAGFLFNFEVSYQGLRKLTQIVPVAVSVDGAYDGQLSDRLLQKSSSKRDELESLPSDFPMDRIDMCYMLAETILQTRMAEQSAALSARLEPDFATEQLKYGRYFDHRLRTAQGKYQRTESTYERLVAENNPAVPIWKRNLENAARHLDELPNERDAFMANLNQRRQVTYASSLYSLAVVTGEAKTPPPTPPT